MLIGTLWLIGVGIAAMSIRHEIDEVFDSALQETAERLLPLALDDLDEHRRARRRGRQAVSDPFQAARQESICIIRFGMGRAA